jgi:tRNA(fMet)-specific endonuclease VapC
MNGNLLDTNVIIRLLNGNQEITSRLLQMEKICMSSVVLGELIYGAEKSGKVEENRRNVLTFCSFYPVYDVTNSVALAYGKIKSSLQKKGKIIPENDMWIAATAAANELTVYTQDKHFSDIDGITVVTI